MISPALVLIAASIAGSSDARAASPVTITNPKDISKALGVESPFAANTGCVNSTGPSGQINCEALVPVNVRWVIKNFSVRCTVPTGISVTQIQLTTITNGVLSGVFPVLPATRPFDSTRWVMTLSQSMEIYADPGSKIFTQANLSANASQNNFICSAEFQGQAVTP